MEQARMKKVINNLENMVIDYWNTYRVSRNIADFEMYYLFAQERDLYVEEYEDIFGFLWTDEPYM